MKDQEIKRQQSGREGVSEIAQADTGDEQDASGNARAGDSGTEVGLKNNQSEKNYGGHDGGDQRVTPVVDRFGFVFEKPREKQDERGLGQFRRLQRNRTRGETSDACRGRDPEKKRR